MMKSRFFNAVTKAPFVGDGTVGDLVDWLETYVNVLFPENGAEYFADYRHGGSNCLKRFQKVPLSVCTDEGFHHEAVYVREGNESKIIEVSLYLRNDIYKSLTFVKMYGPVEDTWMVARALSEVLHSICTWEEIPELVDMARKLPKKYSSSRESSLSEEVLICASSHTLTVTTASGLVLDSRSWKEDGSNAHFSVEPRVKDWITVLTNMKVRFKVQKETVIGVRDLPGYLITDRGVEGCTGLYVLPPGLNPDDDRNYLGFFVNQDLAIAAARQHKDDCLSVTAKAA